MGARDRRRIAGPEMGVIGTLAVAAHSGAAGSESGIGDDTGEPEVGISEWGYSAREMRMEGSSVGHRWAEHPWLAVGTLACAILNQ